MERRNLTASNWLAYWQTAWRERPHAKLYTLYRALPSVLAGAIQFYYLRDRRPVKEMLISIVIIVVVYLILYAAETVWNFSSLSPPLIDQEKTKELADQKKSAEDRQSEQAKTLQGRIRELEDAARIEADRRKVTLSVSLKTEDRLKALLMKMSSQFSSDQSVQAHVSEMTLVIYNHGEKAVRLRGCKLWILGAVESAQELPLHDFLTPDAPATIQMTEPLLRVISRQTNYSFESLQGRYTIRVVVTYSGDSASADSQPFDFQVTCRHEGGGTIIKIIAEEVKL